MCPRLIIFDVDGTLVNSSGVLLRAFDVAFRAQGLSLPSKDRLLSVVGLAHREMFSTLVGENGPVDELVRVYKATSREIRSNGTMDEPLYPGAAEAIRLLSRDPSIRLSLATGKSRAGLDRFLRSQNWTNTFFTTKSSDDGPSKPHPEILNAAMGEANVGSNACVMIGDSVFDIQMARAAGVQAIGVSWGYNHPQVLLAAGASSIASSFPDLMTKLNYSVP